MESTLENITRIKIENTDIFLEDFEMGKGKIIISDSWNGSYTYYWGSMGSDLSKFIQGTNASYFANCMCSDNYTFCGKQSIRNLRKAIKDEFPWYEYMGAQKDLRAEINFNIVGVSSADSFIHVCNDLGNMIVMAKMDRFDEKDFIERLQGILTEPWYMIGEKESTEYKFLYALHGKLKKELSGK